MRVSTLNGQEWATRMSAVTRKEISCGPKAEGAELGDDRVPPLHTILERYAPASHFTV